MSTISGRWPLSCSSLAMLLLLLLVAYVPLPPLRRHLAISLLVISDDASPMAVIRAEIILFESST